MTHALSKDNPPPEGLERPAQNAAALDGAVANRLFLANAYPTASPLPSPPLVLTGQCPRCRNALVIRSPRDQTRFIGCSGFPTCHYRGEYDATLHQLRDRLARAEAEATLLRLQVKPIPAAALISRALVDRELRRLGEAVLRERHEAPGLAAEITKAVLALREVVRGGEHL